MINVIEIRPNVYKLTEVRPLFDCTLENYSYWDLNKLLKSEEPNFPATLATRPIEELDKEQFLEFHLPKIREQDTCGGYYSPIEDFFMDIYCDYIEDHFDKPKEFEGWYLWNMIGNQFARDSISTDNEITKDNGTYVPDAIPVELKEAIIKWLFVYGEFLGIGL